MVFYSFLIKFLTIITNVWLLFPVYCFNETQESAQKVCKDLFPLKIICYLCTRNETLVDDISIKRG